MSLCYFVADETRQESGSPLVIRHSNEPSAWVLTTANTLPTFTEHYSTISHDTRKNQPRASIPISVKTDTVNSVTAGQDAMKTYGESTRQYVSSGLSHGQGDPNTDDQSDSGTGASCLPHDRPWSKDVIQPEANNSLTQSGFDGILPSNSGAHKKVSPFEVDILYIYS